MCVNYLAHSWCLISAPAPFLLESTESRKEQKRQQRGRERGKEIVRGGKLCLFRSQHIVLNKCPFQSSRERRQVRKKVKKTPERKSSVRRESVMQIAGHTVGVY